MTTTSEFRTLGDASDLAEYPVVPYYLSDIKLRISVTKVGDELFAFDDLCPMHHCAFSAGQINGATVMCQCGGCLFDIHTGQVKRGPATTPIKVYPVRQAGDKLEVSL